MILCGVHRSSHLPRCAPSAPLDTAPGPRPARGTTTAGPGSWHSHTVTARARGDLAEALLRPDLPRGHRGASRDRFGVLERQLATALHPARSRAQTASKRSLRGSRCAGSAPGHVFDKQRRFFDAWGCFAESRFPAPVRDVSRETFLRKRTAVPGAHRRDVSRETISSGAAHGFRARAAMFHVKHFCVKDCSAFSGQQTASDLTTDC